MMKYEKIAENGHQRMYRVDAEISKRSSGVNIIYNKDENFTTNYVMISDAHTHLERLAFPLRLVNCETEQQAIDFFNKHRVLSIFHRFRDESNYDKPYVETDYGDIGGNKGWLTGLGDNESLLMTDEEILDEIVEANESNKEDGLYDN